MELGEPFIADDGHRYVFVKNREQCSGCMACYKGEVYENLKHGCTICYQRSQPND